MSGPWEKYGAPAGATSGKPWEKYAAPVAETPSVAAAPVVPEWDQRDSSSVPGGVRAEPVVPSVPETGMTNETYLAQRLSRSVADTIGAPVDLLSAALNIVGGLAGVEGQITQPFMGSDWLANRASEVGQGVGVKTVLPEQVGPNTRVIGEAVRGAGNAALGAGALISGPAQAAKQLLTLTKPYAAAPMATAARDVAAGFGAGTATGAYDENIAPRTKAMGVDGVVDPVAKILAAIAGGVGGVGLASVGEGLATRPKNRVMRTGAGSYDPHAPLNPQTDTPFTRGQMEKAATAIQSAAVNPRLAAENIERNASLFSEFATARETPTTGMLSDDLGLLAQEKALRDTNSVPFQVRDQARQSLASSKLDSSAPVNADGRAFTNEATAQYDATMQKAESGVQTAAQQQSEFTQSLRNKNAELEGYRATQPEASASMAADVEVRLSELTAEKNRIYDKVDPKTPFDSRFLDEALNRIDAEMPAAERLNPGAYSQMSSRIRQLLENDPNTLTFGDAQALRNQLSEFKNIARGRAANSVAGSGSDLRRLDQLNAVLSKQIDDIALEGAEYMRGTYGPAAKDGRMGEYRKALMSGNDMATKPTEFAQKFLRNKEDTESLLRLANTPKPEGTDMLLLGTRSADGASDLPKRTAANAREWMLGDLAKSGALTENAEMRYSAFKKWADKNRKVIDQFPELAEEVNSEIAAAQKGGMLSKQLASDVSRAKENLKITTEQLRRSALQSAIGNNPENAIAQIMGSGDPEKRMAEMVGRLSKNAEAKDGLKAAVRDWIKNKAGTTAGIVGDPDAVKYSRANLNRLFAKHEKTLSKVYSSEEMNVLRQAQKLLNAEQGLAVRATGGSDTFSKMVGAEKIKLNSLLRPFEVGFKLWKGMLEGGGMYRTLRLAVESLPNPTAAAEDIIFEMQFNPELAKHLLTRPLKDVSSPSWNAKLNKLLAVATGAREANED